MLSYFLNYMGQKYGRYICVQILQTLNILFENIRHETSLCKLAFLFSLKTNKSSLFSRLSFIQ